MTNETNETGRAERVEQDAAATRRRDEVVIRIPTLDRLFREIVPDEARQHLRNARRERLLALRSILDAAIERSERAHDEAGADKPARMQIQVD